MSTCHYSSLAVQQNWPSTAAEVHRSSRLFDGRGFWAMCQHLTTNKVLHLCYADFDVNATGTARGNSNEFCASDGNARRETRRHRRCAARNRQKAASVGRVFRCQTAVQHEVRTSQLVLLGVSGPLSWIGCKPSCRRRIVTSLVCTLENCPARFASLDAFRQAPHTPKSNPVTSRHFVYHSLALRPRRRLHGSRMRRRSLKRIGIAGGKG